MNTPIECKADGITREYVIGTSLPKFLCKWWMKTRVVGSYKVNPKYIRDLEGNPTDTMPIIQVYCPWYAKPLDLLHKLIFG